MNEQALADLFSEHIDRLFAGELSAEVPAIADLPELVTLSQNLSQITFQPGSATQAAFQNQVDQWFGSEVPPASKILELPAGLSKSITLVIGLIIAVGSIFLGSSSEAEQFEPVATQPVVSPPEPTLHSTPEIPAIMGPVPATQTPVPATPTPIWPQPTNSLGDSLPTSKPSLGETLPLATPTASSTSSPASSGSPDDTDSDKGTDNPPPAAQPEPPPADGNTSGKDNNGAPLQVDHDRGHGNDPGRFDQDNPGQGGGGKPSSGGGKDSGKGGGGKNGGKGGGKKGK